MTDFPVPTFGDYPITPYYYMNNMPTEDEMTCDPTKDNVESMNVLCSDPTTGEFASPARKVTCRAAQEASQGLGDTITCDVPACEDLLSKWCEHGFVTLWDTTGLAYIGLCGPDTAETPTHRCETVANDIAARPNADDNPPSSEDITKWYVGNADYLLGYSYQCSGDDNVNDYYNALCDDADAFSDTIHVYCADPVAVEGKLKSDPTPTSPFCGATTCAEITDGAICKGGVDLYTVDEDAALTFVSACVPDDSETPETPCVASGDTPAAGTTESSAVTAMVGSLGAVVIAMMA